MEPPSELSLMTLTGSAGSNWAVTGGSIDAVLAWRATTRKASKVRIPTKGPTEAKSNREAKSLGDSLIGAWSPRPICRQLRIQACYQLKY
jgi:hypothetical protein